MFWFASESHFHSLSFLFHLAWWMFHSLLVGDSCWAVKPVKGDGQWAANGDWRMVYGFCVRLSQLGFSLCIEGFPNILGGYFVIQPDFNGPILTSFNLFYCCHPYSNLYWIHSSYQLPAPTRRQNPLLHTTWTFLKHYDGNYTIRRTTTAKFT